jgi:hypothetical protein
LYAIFALIVLVINVYVRMSPLKNIAYTINCQLLYKHSDCNRQKLCDDKINNVHAVMNVVDVETMHTNQLNDDVGREKFTVHHLYSTIYHNISHRG